MAAINLEKDKIVVIAIDFGTTFSGYAFAFTSKKRQILINKNWGAGQSFQSYKAPTCVLLANNGEFLAFGYDAENDFVETTNHLFRHFKMVLHKEVEDRKKVCYWDIFLSPVNKS